MQSVSRQSSTSIGLCKHDADLRRAWRSQATKKAERLVKHSVGDNEQLPVSSLWQAADMYREAIVLTRDKDVVGEAKACSRCVLVYFAASWVADCSLPADCDAAVSVCAHMTA